MTSIGKKFSFVSKAGTLATDTFDVVSFTGTEGLSKLYHFDVTLVSDNDGIDLEGVIQSRAALSILRDDGNIVFNGMLSAFEQMETAQGLTHYRAVLTPAFWRQTLTHHNQIFLDKTIPQIIEAALQDGGLTSLDYELRLTGQYQPHEYICQYNESHFSFISRLMEREGIYYYFEQGAECEKLIITDTALLHSVMAEGTKMFYSQPSGLDEASREEVVKSLVCSQKMLPAKVLLKDYNYRKPSLELSVEHVVSERGFGDVFIYGEHFSTPEEGAQLAKMRAEALMCRARLFQGESLIPYLRPGYLFQLAGHNRADFNDTYLTTDLTHNGDQTFLFTSGLGVAGSSRERFSAYHNSFTAISSSSQFRPERVTEKPRVPGTMNAHIDAAGSGQYAEVDNQGRYKVVLPFDLNNTMGGKASSWLRMAQPYAGENHGMHFPLHKGTEVLLTFVDGDPDRPIIAAAVPNPITPSPVNSANATQSRITTAGGNKLHMEDQQGSEGMLLQTPKSNTSFRLGLVSETSETEPPTNQELQNQINEINTELETEKSEQEEEEANSGVSIYTGAGIEITSAWENSLTLGECTEVTVGIANDIMLGSETSITAGSAMEVFLGTKMDMTVANTVDLYWGDVYSICKDNELTGQNSVLVKAGGTSPPIWAAATAMLALTAATTVAAAAMGKASKANTATITSINEILMALDVALSLYANSALCKAADKVLYNSTIELGTTGIEEKVTAGNIEQKVSLGSIEQVVITGNIEQTVTTGDIQMEVDAGKIKLNVGEGNVTQRVITGNIGQNVTTGDIDQTVTTGNIEQEVITGNIEQKVTTGNIKQTVVAGNIELTAAASKLTMNADQVKLNTTGDFAKLDLNTNQCTVSANTGNFQFLSSVSIQAGAIIKLQ
ncbi:type VI secretion system tip protein TssI/VgrG [uncultured Desulfobulbus sp.]|uniref:type VI secretion system tip protein TssI/VgrG n=1 Tax=uncultured Desulfobulbus sp. TaxID=239745 RepID=UPI0029C62FE5|nr:type VI secretion system tip protein TssI/VgrG [uncultured Desulfobulbus sp.]